MTTNRHPFDVEPHVIKAKAYKPKDGSEPGDRIRVVFSDMPAMHRMIGHGWARHLPVELGAMFLVVACQDYSHITGDLMWFNIRDLYSKTLQEAFLSFPEDKKVEVERRFADEYGKPYKTTVKGLIKVLIELGLVERYWANKGEGLRIPQILPWPNEKLNLSQDEVEIVAWRKGFTHTSLVWVDPEMQERGHL